MKSSFIAFILYFRQNLPKLQFRIFIKIRKENFCFAICVHFVYIYLIIIGKHRLIEHSPTDYKNRLSFCEFFYKSYCLIKVMHAETVVSWVRVKGRISRV